MAEIMGSVIVLLVIAFIYSKMADISFGKALGKVISGILKAFLAILSFIFSVGASGSSTRNIRAQAKKKGRDDIVADIDAKVERAKNTKEGIDNFRKNL